MNGIGFSAVLFGSVKVHGVTVHVKLDTDRQVARLEFNAARMVVPAPGLLPAAALGPLVRGMVLHLNWLLGCAVVRVDQDTGEIDLAPRWRERIRIRRLDIARNMYVDHPDLIKAAAEKTAARYGTRRAVNSNTNGVWSVVDYSKKDGEDSCYLKKGGAGSRDVLRFETRLKSRRLQKFGLTTLAHLDEAACWNALSSRWDSSRNGKPFRTGGALSDALQALAPRTRDSILALMTARENGFTTAGSKRTVQKYEKLARSMGLVPGIPLADQGGELRYLDLWGGVERLVPTAAEDVEGDD